MEFCWKFVQCLNVFLILVVIEITNANAKDASKKVAAAATIAMVGRNGSGISTTTRELIGPNFEKICKLPDSKESLTNIMEYTIDIPVNNTHVYILKLWDIPGFADGQNDQQRSEILASLKSVVQSTGYPDFYLALSKFDDNKINDPASDFVKFLKTLELFFNTTYVNKNFSKNNTLFLLTHFMSVPQTEQELSNEKLDDFKSVIEQNSSFPFPISIVVGDNEAVSERNSNDGFYNLSNNQLYPKNVWEGLHSLTKKIEIKNLLTKLINNRRKPTKCETRLIPTKWDNYDNDARAFKYLLKINSLIVESTDINEKIQTAFDKYNDSLKLESVVQKVALQFRLQEKNVKSLNNPQMTEKSRVEFFQGHEVLSAPIVARLLEEAVNLKMPEYIDEINVGRGYVLLTDSVANELFNHTSKESPVGFKIPSFMKCEKLVRPQQASIKSQVANMSEYIEERLSRLKFNDKEKINKSLENFKLTRKQGYNFQDEVSTLTVFKEVRILTCNLEQDFTHLELSNEFKEEVNELTKFDKNNKESPKIWKRWFDKWGSHLVVKSFGGGTIYGRLEKENLRKTLETESNINITLDSIDSFTKTFPKKDLGDPTYIFSGGNPDELRDSKVWYSTEENERQRVYNGWQDSLNYRFIMLQNDLELLPISNLIKAKFGIEKGDIVEEAVGLYLGGQLRYERRKQPPSGGGINSSTNNNEEAKNTPPPSAEGSTAPEDQQHHNIVDINNNATNTNQNATNNNQNATNLNSNSTATTSSANKQRVFISSNGLIFYLYILLTFAFLL